MYFKGKACKGKNSCKSAIFNRHKNVKTAICKLGGVLARGRTLANPELSLNFNSLQSNCWICVIMRPNNDIQVIELNDISSFQMQYFEEVN